MNYHYPKGIVASEKEANRKKLLSPLGNDVKQLMCDTANRYHFRIVEMEVDKDHIHLFIHILPLNLR
ncbi:transposase [Bacillaceae bacterium Marseille-Q3522]|nr:transposase [Bacillaceae bacterium Marseille-Q3522]